MLLKFLLKNQTYQKKMHVCRKALLLSSWELTQIIYGVFVREIELGRMIERKREREKEGRVDRERDREKEETACIPLLKLFKFLNLGITPRSGLKKILRSKFLIVF